MAAESDRQLPIKSELQLNIKTGSLRSTPEPAQILSNNPLTDIIHIYMVWPMHYGSMKENWLILLNYAAWGQNSKVKITA